MTSPTGFAEAVFLIAKQDKQLKKFQKDLQLVCQNFHEVEDLMSFFQSQKVDLKAKENVVEKAFQNKIELNLVNFLKLLVSKQSLNQIFEISQLFNNKVNQELGIMEGIIFSPKKLLVSEMKAITKKISSKLNHEVSLVNKVDPTMIFGLKVIVDNQIIEDTIESRFHILKTQIIK